jgi:acetolactate synthase-1/2/3 large subunit
MNSDETCADRIARGLQDREIRHVFGVPGAHVSTLCDAIARLGSIEFHTTRHEQGCAYMALGHARATGRPSAFVVVPGPGLLSAGAAIATAYACNAPVLCLVGQISTAWIGRRLGMLHEVDNQLAVFASVTKWRGRLERASDLPALIDAAFTAMTSGRPGPAILELPTDVMDAPAAPGPDCAPRTDRPQAGEPQDIAHGVERLNAARRPLILVGGGAAQAEKELLELADCIGAPIVATLNFRAACGGGDSRHYLSAYAARWIWQDCDLVLAVGTRLQAPFASWGWGERPSLVRIDIDPDQIAIPRRADVAIVADAGTALRQIKTAMRGRMTPGQSAVDIESLNDEIAQRLACLQPQADFCAAIDAALPGDAIVAIDSTQIGYYVMQALPLAPARHLLTAGYMGAMGSAFPMALGAKLAYPHREVIALCGDGGFIFSLQELATARQDRIGVRIVLFDDGGFGEVRRVQRQRHGGRLVGSDLLNPDFTMLASSFGIDAVSADDPARLADALLATRGRDDLVIIHVRAAFSSDLASVTARTGSGSVARADR